MRNLDRDRQRCLIARFEGLTPQEDSQGRLTGKNVPSFEQPEEFWPTVSPVRGEALGAYFGQNLDYDLTLTVDDPAFAIDEADVLWVYAPEEGCHDYAVKRVARKGDYTVIAAKHVEVRP